MRTAIGVANDYVTLTKPRIISLLLLTCVATMFVADPGGPALSTILWTCLGGYLAAGGAGAINHYIERERDARMARTRGRPLASGRIEPRRGLLFGSTLGIVAVVQLAVTVNALTAALAAAGLLGYVFVYTLWLKPRTPQNIVLGGAAGAMPPLVGWAAATGELSRPGALAVRDRLLLDPAPLLGAVAADLRRLRPHRRADAAGGPRRDHHPPPDRRLRAAAGRDHGRARSSPGCSGPSTWSRRSPSAPGSSAWRWSCSRIPRGRRPAASTSARWPTWRCSSWRWPSTGAIGFRPWIASAPEPTSVPAWWPAPWPLLVFALAFYVSILYLR